jgi:hypothetical protein
MLEQKERAFAFSEISQAIIEVCAPLPNVCVIDGLSLVPHFPSLYDAGGVHPVDEGFLHMAMNIIKAIQN